MVLVRTTSRLLPVRFVYLFIVPEKPLGDWLMKDNK